MIERAEAAGEPARHQPDGRAAREHRSANPRRSRPPPARKRVNAPRPLPPRGNPPADIAHMWLSEHSPNSTFPSWGGAKRCDAARMRVERWGPACPAMQRRHAARSRRTDLPCDSLLQDDGHSRTQQLSARRHRRLHRPARVDAARRCVRDRPQARRQAARGRHQADRHPDRGPARLAAAR